jgi:cell division protease FtsH
MAWTSNQQVFLGEDLMTQGREYSDTTANMLDEEISRILTTQEQRAHDLLSKHRKGLDFVAEALLEHETIDGPTVGKLVQEGLEESENAASSTGTASDSSVDNQASTPGA